MWKKISFDPCQSPIAKLALGCPKEQEPLGDKQGIERLFSTKENLDFRSESKCHN